MNAVAGQLAAGKRSQIIEGEFPFTYEDFRQIAEMLHSDAGIALPESKATLVYSRLAKRLRSIGLRSFHEYCKLVQSHEGIDERKRMLAALTTNVTRFFREPHHFDHLASNVLPRLLDTARAGGRVRIWSAGCSSGQEPYSIALTILSFMPDAANYDIRILATDIDPNVIAEARRGVYRDDVISAVPANVRSRWFENEGSGTWRVAAPLAQLVVFRELNLIGDWPMRGPFQAIFCRNVVIYFEESTQLRIWNRFKGLLSPGGYLYIGHSERMGAAEDGFESDGLTTYRFHGGMRQ